MSSACFKCGGYQSLVVDHDLNCTKCDGTGYVNETSGGGTEPRPEGSPPVYGTRLDLVACKEGRLLHVECGSCGNRFRVEMR